MCLFLLEINNTGVDALRLDSLEETDWYQTQVIRNWLVREEVSIENVKKLLCEWYEQLYSCEKRTLLEEMEFQAMDFLPYKQGLDSIYQKIIPNWHSNEKLYSGKVIENDEETETYSIEVLGKTVSGKKDIKLNNIPGLIQTKCLQCEKETPKWETMIGREEYFFYSIQEGKGYFFNRELLKALSGVELVLENCLEFTIGRSVTSIEYDSVYSFMKLFESIYCKEAKNKRACPCKDLESQTCLRLLYNMIWSEIDTEEKKDSYFGIFRAHQKADFDGIDKDEVFSRKINNTLYIPKDRMVQESVLATIFDKRLKAVTERDTRHLYMTELTKTDDGKFAIYGEPIERIVFLTDNMVGGSSTIAALAAQFCIEKDDDYHITKRRVEQANATKHIYFCEKQEVSVVDILKTNQINITVYAYYGTEAACEKVNGFLKKNAIPFEKSAFCYRLSNKADEHIIESAKGIWGDENINIKNNHYLYVREYNMPKSSIFPAKMLEYPSHMINLMFRNHEL